MLKLVLGGVSHDGRPLGCFLADTFVSFKKKKRKKKKNQLLGGGA